MESDLEDSESNGEEGIGVKTQHVVKTYDAEYQFLQNQGFYTLSDLSSALAMNKEEKTMSRVLQEIRKVHKSIGEKANRYGRTF
jgi:pyruvate/oxaloacetate carboxyltransferase